MPGVKEDIDTILFWKERHHSVIRSFHASQNNGAATPIGDALKTLDPIMKMIRVVDSLLKKVLPADAGLANEMKYAKSQLEDQVRGYCALCIWFCTHSKQFFCL